MYLIYLYRVIHFYITLRGLGWLGLGWDHVSFGGVDRCIDRYLDRLSIDISVAMSVESRPSIGGAPVESFSSIGRERVESPPICWRHSAATVYRSIVGR